MADGSIRVVTKLDNTALKQQIKELERELAGLQKEKEKAEAAISKSREKYDAERDFDSQFPEEFSHREDIDQRASKDLDPLIAKQDELNQKEQQYISLLEAAKAKLAEQASIADASKQVDQDVKSASSVANITTQEEYNSLLDQTRAKMAAIEAAAAKVAEQTGVSKNKILEANPAYQKLKDTMGVLNAKASEFGKKAKKAGKDAAVGLSQAKKQSDGLASSIGKGIKKLGKMALAVFGIRAAYSAVRSAMTEYMSTHKELEGKVQVLKTYFAELLGPAIELIINLFWYAVQAVNSFIYALTGINFAAKANESALNGQADATNNAANAAKQLAGFDEQNKLSGGGGGGGSSSGSNESLPELDTDFGLPIVEKIIGDIREKLESLCRYILTIFAPSFSSWGEAFLEMKEPLMGAFDSIGQSMSGLWEDTIAPFGTYLLEDFIAPIANAFSETVAPIFSDTMATALEEFTLDFELACQTMDSLINDLIIPDMELFKTVCVDAITTVGEEWEKSGDKLTELFQGFKESIRTIWTNLYETILKPIWQTMTQALSDIWDEHLAPLWEKIVSFFSKLGECIMTIWNNFLGPIINWLISIFGPTIAAVADTTWGVVESIFGFISDVLGGVLDALGGLLDFITGVFSGNWELAWSGIKDFFKGIWDAILGIFKGVVNAIIGILNTLWTVIYTAVAGIVNTIGSIAGWIGELFGSDWSFSMPSKPPTIPYLAKGGIVNNPGKGEFFLT